MSHVAHVDCFIKDQVEWRSAVEECGGTVHEGQKTFGWYGQWVNDFRGNKAAVDNGFKPEDYGHCEHAVSIPGSTYELGMVARPDGGEGYAVIYDKWGSDGAKLHRAFGKDLCKVKGRYAERVAMKALKRQGYLVRVEEQAGGVRQVVGTRMKRR